MRPRSALAVLVVLLAGCSSPDDGPPAASPAPEPSPVSLVPEPAVEPTTTSAAPSPSAPASPSAEATGPPPTSGPVHLLGDRVRLVTGSRMTVFGWQRAQRPGSPAVGAWWAADVEFCLTRTFGDHFQEPIANIRSALVAELSDGRALTPEAHPRGAEEVYARPIPVVAGQCRRGNLVFDVPAGTQPAYLSVTFSPFSWVRWQLA